jgi:hypothetical protein
MSLYEMLQKKVDELSEAVIEAQDKAKKAVAYVNEIETKLSTYQSALEAEMRDRGMLHAVVTKLPENGPRGAKTDFIKKVIQKAENGVTPGEIKEELKKAGIKVHPNYTYAVLIRAKGKGEIIEKNGRYFPKPLT